MVAMFSFQPHLRPGTPVSIPVSSGGQDTKYGVFGKKPNNPIWLIEGCWDKWLEIAQKGELSQDGTGEPLEGCREDGGQMRFLL